MPMQPFLLQYQLTQVLIAMHLDYCTAFSMAFEDAWKL